MVIENTRLRILQYNINHGKEATQIPLLQDTKIQDFDILAIQEPWRNPFIATSYNPPQSNFHLIYPSRNLTRVCLYINKRLHPDTWSVTDHSEDAQTITIKIGSQRERVIKIHNIYNPSPQSYSARTEGTLAILRNTLETSGTGDEHIIIGDFNLHHPYWSGLTRLTQHAAADTLLDIARNEALILATPQGTTTWQSRGLQSTIDLAFISSSLENELIKCTPRADLAQSSDHIPIEITFRIQPEQFVSARRKCWKKMDTEILKSVLESKIISNSPLHSNEQIDARVSEITQAFQDAIEQSTPWARTSNNAKTYWSDECAEAVREARKAFYNNLRENTALSDERHKEARNRKVAIIRKFKKDCFRSQVAEITSNPQGA